MTKEDKQIIDRATKEEWRIGDRSRLKRLLEKNLKLYRENVELEKENKEMKKGLGCETCQIHLEYMGLNDKINKLEKEYKLLGERCNQLLKDKGDLTDRLDNQMVNYETLKLHDQEEIGMLNSKIAELENALKGYKENATWCDNCKKIAGLKQQIEKMKRHCNCKHRDSEGYCEVKRTYLIDLSYDGCDKWELEND